MFIFTSIFGLLLGVLFSPVFLTLFVLSAIVNLISIIFGRNTQRKSKYKNVNLL